MAIYKNRLRIKLMNINRYFSLGVSVYDIREMEAGGGEAQWG